ncbi:MAG TPA: hypothetical protein VGR21_04845 [Cryptosporangiaceae bacterium]|nr:hypothetical protein [Cryptosporangiaceae bacterium]
MPDPAPEADEIGAWLTEHERALDRLRAKVVDLEHRIETDRETAVPHALGAAGILVLLVALSLPWLVRPVDPHTTSAWSLLLAPTDAPVIASAAYLVLVAAVTQATALTIRTRAAAIVAAVASAGSGLSIVALIFVVAGAPDIDAGTGPGLSLGLQLLLAVLWGSVAESRRWAA